MTEKSLSDYKVVVSFARSRGHLDAMRSQYMDVKSYERELQKLVKKELAERLAAQIVNKLEDTIEPVNAEDGILEWKLEAVAIPYDTLINLLDN